MRAFPIDATWYRRALLFAISFGILIAPWPGLPALYRECVEQLANVVLTERSWHPTAMLWLRGGDELDQFTRVRGVAWRDAWLTTLWIENATTAARTWLPIDLRALLYLPTVTSLALALSVPIGRGVQRLWLCAAGLTLSQLVSWTLAITPVAAYLGGASPVRVFTLNDPTEVALNVVYRALLAPPGMAYAVPGMIWFSIWWFETQVRSQARSTPPVSGHR